MEPRPPAAENDGSGTTAGPGVQGVRLYLNAGEAIREKEPTPAAAPVLPPPVLISLVAADVLLCLLAWWMVKSSHGAPGWFGWLLAGTAIIFGAWLSLLAVNAFRSRRSVAVDPRPINGAD